MASIHVRQASTNTAFEARPQTADANSNMISRARSPVSHSRMLSLGSAEKNLQDHEPLLYQSGEPYEYGHGHGHEPGDISIQVPTGTSSWRRSNVLIGVLWVLSLVFTSVCTYAITKRAHDSDSFGSFHNGWATDLHDARRAIRVQTEQFHSELDFKERHGFIPPDSPNLKYIGTGPHVDFEWEEISKNRYFLITDSEAAEAYGPGDIAQYWNVHHGGYVAGLDVLHTLHCLNHLRMSLYPTVYPQDPTGTMHKAHCVDHLRQLAMCHADLTPVPTQYFHGLGRNYINSSRVHTCRDFGPIRAWASERFNGSTAVRPRDRDGSPREAFYVPWDP